MDFLVSKLLGWIVMPSNALIILAFLTALPLDRGRPWRRRLRLIAPTILLAVAVLPIADLMIRPLENRFVRPEPMPARVDGIIVLGGSLRPELSKEYDEANTNDANERLHAGLRLALRYPEARLVFTGGTANPWRTDTREAQVVERWYREAGLPAGRLTLEDRSRNTFENAAFTRELVRPRPGETWLLVTSAYHMPRSMDVFRAEGWQGLIAWPVDYRSDLSLKWSPLVMASEKLANLDLAAHEWAGLVYYRLRGWTSSLLPSPEEPPA